VGTPTSLLQKLCAAAALLSVSGCHATTLTSGGSVVQSATEAASLTTSTIASGAGGGANGEGYSGGDTLLPGILPPGTLAICRGAGPLGSDDGMIVYVQVEGDTGAVQAAIFLLASGVPADYVPAFQVSSETLNPAVLYSAPAFQLVIHPDELSSGGPRVTADFDARINQTRVTTELVCELASP
jgi:uncharacterized membrane protein